MRVPLAVLAALLSFATPTFAQAPAPAAKSEQAARKERVGTVKLVAGIAAAGVGAVMVATGGGSGGYQRLNDRNRFIGLAVAGGGGYLIWDGLTDRAEAKRLSVSVAVTPRSAGVALRKRW